ncbi:MAG TPA: hypothetical protein VEQ66_04680 [Propionibacteriaceae bacterium]|nr:hypothetical protein [Propionibacteriaceae bacterium]
MKTAYRVLAHLIAAAVVVQAASIAFALFGLSSYITGGGTIDKAAVESGTTSFTGEAGFPIHGMVGMMLIPALALLLVIISFFAKVLGGVKWALYVFGAVVLQVGLAIFGRTLGLPALGLLHGANAFVLMALAEIAARRARRAEPAATADRSAQVSSYAR